MTTTITSPETAALLQLLTTDHPTLQVKTIEWDPYLGEVVTVTRTTGGPTLDVWWDGPFGWQGFDGYNVISLDDDLPSGSPLLVNPETQTPEDGASWVGSWFRSHTKDDA